MSNDMRYTNVIPESDNKEPKYIEAELDNITSFEPIRGLIDRVGELEDFLRDLANNSNLKTYPMLKDYKFLKNENENKKPRIAKSKTDIMHLLEVNNYERSEIGWVDPKHNLPVFNNKMWDYCLKEVDEKFNWHPCWLEE